MRFLVQWMHRAFATLEEELRTINCRERHHFHIADELFAPTETKALLNGEPAVFLHNLVKASIFDEGVLDNGVAEPKILSDHGIISNALISALRGMRRQVRSNLNDSK